MTDSSLPSRVLVTGATGETGREVVRKLVERGIPVRAFVRSEQKARELLADGVELAPGDVTDPASIDAAMQGCDVLVILTSSKPQRTGTGPDGRPEFSYPPDATPEKIDYHGQVAQIEAARAAGIRHVVLVSSMGMADPENHFLNKIGGGRILTWKLKAEDHLRASGLPYTIVRPGGLVNEPGGEKEIVISHNDERSGRIARADVAEICVQAMLHPELTSGKTFDIAWGEGPPASDFASLLATA